MRITHLSHAVIRTTGALVIAVGFLLSVGTRPHTAAADPPTSAARMPAVRNRAADVLITPADLHDPVVRTSSSILKPDLKVFAGPSVTGVFLDETDTFTVQVHNDGLFPVQGVTLTVAFPPIVEVLDAQERPSPFRTFTCTVTTPRLVTCTGTLTADAITGIEYRVRGVAVGNGIIDAQVNPNRVVVERNYDNNIDPAVFRVVARR